MKIAVLGVGHIGSTVGRLWHAAGHEVTFAGRDEEEPRELAADLGDCAHAATVADAVAEAGAVLVAVPGPAVADVLTAAGRLDGKIIIDAANMMGQYRLSLRQLADAFPAARWVRAFNTLQARVLADENHRLPRWVVFLSGDEQAKSAVARLIADAGFEPLDLGGIDDSQFQEPGSARPRSRTRRSCWSSWALTAASAPTSRRSPMRARPRAPCAGGSSSSATRVSGGY
jgi:8-hydroxy-5-deazaflavin:NADPH oxidoreductase